MTHSEGNADTAFDDTADAELETAVDAVLDHVGTDAVAGTDGDPHAVDGRGPALQSGNGRPPELAPPAWGGLRERRITPEQWRRFEGYVAEIFQAMGMELGTPGTDRTPERFLRALYDSTSGYEGDGKLITSFPTECRGGPDCRISQVIEGPIPFFSLCEHHALPFYGLAHLGYVAHEEIIGISKLTRLVRMFARRFTVQERLGQEIAGALVDILEPHGVAVHLHAVHLCTQMRGVSEEHSRTWTSFWRGNYEDDPHLRSEFLAVCRQGVR